MNHRLHDRRMNDRFYRRREIDRPVLASTKERVISVILAVAFVATVIIFYLFNK